LKDNKEILYYYVYIMQLGLLFALFANVFAENSLRGSYDMSTDINDLNNNEVFHWKEFSNFQDRFRKHYSTIEELETRFAIFRENFVEILIHNADLSQNFTLGVNQFTDLTADEFKALYVSGLKTEVGSYGCKTYTSSASGAPSSFDWRNNGAVTSVKDQGQCGSCWSFSSTGAIEGAWAISKGQLVDLSEQELVDCATGISYGSHGCNGGQMEGAFKFVIEKGQCSLASYPYTAKDGSCKTCSALAHISSCSDVKPNDQISLKGAVAQQPVSVAISADTKIFQSYSGGIITSSSCYTSLNHGVLVVGYGSENGQDYWLVKNSWGESWGLNGYVKIGRSESTNDAGVCGIAMDASFPTV
jgi:C1A family cysteine protease